MEGIDWGVVIAAIALIFSVYTFRKTQNLAEKQASLVDDQKRLNELLVAREEKAAVSEKRAELSANLIRLGGVKNKVRVFNKGNATARNVEISFPEGNDLVYEVRGGGQIPVRTSRASSVGGPDCGGSSELQPKAHDRSEVE